MKIAIMGTGGLGSYIGGRLAYRGQDVTFISRGRQLAALQKDGLKINSHFGEFGINPVQATDDCQSAGIVDLVFFCVKSYDIVEAAEQMRPLVGPDTIILPVLNGIDHLETLGDLFTPKQILGGTCIIAAHVTAPGCVRQFGPYNELAFGEVDGSISDRCQQIKQLLDNAGIEGNLTPDIITKMWWKLAAMSALFGVYSLARATADTVRKNPELLETLLNTAEESISVARANGIMIADELIAEIKEGQEILPADWQPSMTVALSKKKPLELDHVNGSIRQFGLKAGVPTPYNDMIYAALKPFAAGVPPPSLKQLQTPSQQLAEMMYSHP